jgi:hypothetical protein
VGPHQKIVILSSFGQAFHHRPCGRKEDVYAIIPGYALKNCGQYTSQIQCYATQPQQQQCKQQHNCDSTQQRQEVEAASG